MKHTSSLLFFALASSVAAGCGDGSSPASTADGGARRAIGMITVNGHVGVGYDTDGDGDAEGVDLDGDGAFDGEDLDGDGRITVWADLRTGDLPPAPNAGMRSVDPDLFAALDPSNPPLNSTPAGQVNEPARVVADAPAGVIAARDQAQQGSCAAFAVGAVATLARQHYARLGGATAAVPLNTDDFWASTAWLYARMVARTQTMMCNGGTSIDSGLSLLATTGAATWAEMPYRSGAMPTLCEPITDATARAPEAFRIGSYARVTGAGTAFRGRVRESLAAGLPVAFGAQLPQGFMGWRSSTQGVDVTSVFRNNGRCTESGHCGGHAMVITGYDDARGAYRVLNSWGTDWGDRGYVWWDYAALEAAESLHAFVIVPLPTAPQPLGAPDPAGLTMAQPTGGRVVLVQQDGSWNLVMRVLFSEPVTVTNVGVEIGGSTLNNTMETGMTYGDIVAATPGDAMPAAGTTANVTVNARLRNGATVERRVSVTIPAPTTVN